MVLRTVVLDHSLERPVPKAGHETSSLTVQSFTNGVLEIAFASMTNNTQPVKAGTQVLASAIYDLMKFSRSGLITSACVIGIS